MMLTLLGLCAWGQAGALEETPPQSATQSPPLVFGLQPFASPPALFQRYAPLRDWLANETGHPTRLESARDLATLVARGRDERYDLMLVAPHVVPLLLDHAPYHLVARTEEQLAMVLLVRPGDSIASISDLAGRTIAAPYEESRAATLARGVTDAQDWPDPPGPPRYRYYHHNSAAIAAFQRELTDALVMIIEGTVLPAPPPPNPRRPRHLSLADGSLVRILAQSERFPGLALLIHERLAEQVPDLDARVTSMPRDEAEATLLRQIGHRSFVSTHAGEYTSFRGALESMERQLELETPNPP
ncbi:PhnD/SsuA/transferrin family substrate-binding protein [Thioalkalivibrio sp. ALE31]|uniref:PhnD/SsuA/transferrin family substrate-binding protein n=1 Tax=Thioalkalivibrio sp. ALE31 TaxID=1158182 RepID=UPI001E52CCD6|nr:PhnD/SsuA/transferrin family substrate-binding protein [Thioalkalivibrio sp. ALE31]